MNVHGCIGNPCTICYPPKREERNWEREYMGRWKDWIRDDPPTYVFSSLAPGILRPEPIEFTCTIGGTDSFTLPMPPVRSQKVRWTCEVAKEILVCQNPAAEAEFASIIAEKIREEIDAQLGQAIIWAEAWNAHASDAAVKKTLGDMGWNISWDEKPRAPEVMIPRFNHLEFPRIKNIDPTPIADAFRPIIDPERFPHSCPRCRAPAYIGFTTVECSDAGCR